MMGAWHAEVNAANEASKININVATSLPGKHFFQHHHHRKIHVFNGCC